MPLMASPAGEVVASLVRHDPACRQVDGDHADPLLCKLGFQSFPVIGRQTGQPVNLLDHEDIAALGIGEQPEQLWAP
jgi:hypothetical protein